MSDANKARVSIMIPTYNQAEFIGEAINSALLQTYPNLEVVVGDDASTDATQEIIATISDSRLKYIRNPSNLGRAGNYRNLLKNHATGDYVINLDGDDYYTDCNFIADALKTIEAHKDVVMVVAKAKTKYESGEYDSDIPDSEELPGSVVVGMLPDRSFFVKHMATLYRRQLAVELGFYRSSAISSDWESLYRLALRGNIRYLDRTVGVWRIHGRNESATISPGKHLENLAIWPPIYEDAIAFGMNPLLAQLACAKCISFSAQMSCLRISLRSKAEVLQFLIGVFANYKLAAMVMLLTPKFMPRMLLCLTGYYRRKATF